MPFKNVALIGASGTLGPSILNALRAHPVFIPFVLNRHSSKSVYPKTRVITIPDDLNVADVTQLLKESQIDALVIAIAGSRVEQAKKLIEAAFRAGVKRVIPAEFGSCDSADDRTVELLPLMEGKKRVRGLLEELSAKERGEGVGKMSWTALVTGHFFDYGLSSGLLKFDVSSRTAYIIDGGNVTFSASNLDFIATAVIKVLEKEEETKNKLLYVHSHSVTQNEVLAVLEKATGEEWKRVPEDYKTVIEHARPKMLAGDAEATEEVVSVHGLVASDWRENPNFANDMLGLREEDLDQVVRKVLAK